MIKIKKFTAGLTSSDYLDITIHIKKGKIVKFAINYRALIKNKWREIYRIDNYHGFLHEQRFWRSKIPIPLHTHQSIQSTIEEYYDILKHNYCRYRKYYEEQDERSN